MLPKKELICLLLLSFMLFLAANIGKFPLFAGQYPDRPVTLIVPYTAGGAADLVARTLEKPFVLKN